MFFHDMSRDAPLNLRRRDGLAWALADRAGERLTCLFAVTNSGDGPKARASNGPNPSRDDPNPSRDPNRLAIPRRAIPSRDDPNHHAIPNHHATTRYQFERKAQIAPTKGGTK
jgi:hypothetical protein